MVSYLKNGQNNGFDNPIFYRRYLVRILLYIFFYYSGLKLYITESSLTLVIYASFQKLSPTTVTYVMVF